MKKILFLLLPILIAGCTSTPSLSNKFSSSCKNGMIWAPSQAGYQTPEQGCYEPATDQGKKCYSDNDCTQVCWPYYKSNEPLGKPDSEHLSKGLKYDSEGFIVGICSISTPDCPYNDHFLPKTEYKIDDGGNLLYKEPKIDSPLKRKELYTAINLPCSF